jgi:hypothetical protein
VRRGRSPRRFNEVLHREVTLDGPARLRLVETPAASSMAAMCGACKGSLEGQKGRWDQRRTPGRGPSAHHHVQRGHVGCLHPGGDRFRPRRRRVDRRGNGGTSVHLGDGRRVRRGRARGRADRGRATTLMGGCHDKSVLVGDRARQRPAFAAKTARAMVTAKPPKESQRKASRTAKWGLAGLISAYSRLLLRTVRSRRLEYSRKRLTGVGSERRPGQGQ